MTRSYRGYSELKWSWHFLLITILFAGCIPSAYSFCSQYEVSSANVLNLHCKNVFSSCNYVAPAQQTCLLNETENQLDKIFNLAQISVEAGDISQSCFLGFSSFYCHQVFLTCQNNLTTEPSTYFPVETQLCFEDCESIIGMICTVQYWNFLTNIIDELKRIESIHLPSLKQRSDCNSSLELSTECTSVLTNSPPTNSCMPSQLPITTDKTNPENGNSTHTTLIIALCLSVGIPVITLSSCVFLVILCCVRMKDHKSRDGIPQYQNQNISANPLEEAIEFKLDLPDTGPVNEPESEKRGTLMLRKSAYQNALFVNTSPRSNTLAKRLANKEYLQMTPKQRLNELDFPHSNICLLKDLWETNFGMTYQGEATGLEEDVVSTTVFIKSLKERASFKVREQFVIEMTWASGFNHPNVITLLGVCREQPSFMIYEYLEYGSLKEFLQSLNSAWFDFDEALNETASTCPSTSAYPLGIEDLCNILHQVADGMDYLSKKAFVLKDLAARNCQVGNGLRVKIANFGLSYDQLSKDYCCLSSTSARSTPLPLRWLAPETIRYNKFSVYSDIWSYGVVMWEVFTFGARPFEKLTNAQVVQHVLNEKYLGKPDECPDVVYEFMVKCWSKQPSKRPWFSILSKEISNCPKSVTFEERKAFGGPPTPDLRRPVSSVSSMHS